MFKTIISLIAAGSSFTMCDGGPVPEGCCEPGDVLNVVVDSQERCDHIGGRLNGIVCEDVDF